MRIGRAGDCRPFFVAGKIGIRSITNWRRSGVENILRRYLREALFAVAAGNADMPAELFFPRARRRRMQLNFLRRFDGDIFLR